MPAKIVEVHPGIYEIFLPLPMRPTIINGYLIDCHGKWVLIDTGMNTPESVSTLEEAFATLGLKIEDLDVLIATHYHVDHFGASGTIQQRSGAKVYLNELELERANRMLRLAKSTPMEIPEARAFFIRNGFPVDRFAPEGMRPSWFGTSQYNPCTTPDLFIRDGDVIPIGDRKLEVIWTPGHSPGHTVLYLRDEKVMIVGDHLLPKITPHVGLYPESPPNPLGDFLASQRKVQPFDVETVLPSHGAVYHDHRHRSNQLIEHHHYRENEILDIVRHRPLTAFEVAQQIFADPNLPVFHVMAATFETLAHLEFSHLEGRARKVERGDRTLYQTA
ncbi:MAG: MBL fold metallo-hydrolase [Candidatus Binataceae bacterium]|jgi:glyoxylase-like metal-dependent hydrolase (beta-lactamase superfamily II)